jgi:glycosidase
LTGPGVPFIYYGEEIGLTGEKPDEEIRTPMAWDGTSPAAGFSTGTPWEPLEAGWETRNVAAESADPSSLLSTYRTMIRLRAAHPALRDGSTTPTESSDAAVDAVVRTSGGETVVVVANVSDAQVDGATLSLEAGVMCGEPRAILLETGAAVAPPTIGADGGFSGWALPSLAPRSVTLIGLG